MQLGGILERDRSVAGSDRVDLALVDRPNLVLKKKGTKRQGTTEKD